MRPDQAAALLRASLVLCALAVLSGCSTLRPAGFTTWQIESPPDDHRVLFQGIPVRTGQIVASEQGSPQSIFLSLLVADNYPFVHTGVVSIEDGVPVVYEANGQIKPNFSGDPPTRHVGGGLRRVTLETFLQRQRFIALYDPPPGVDGERVGQFARDSLAQGLPFDSYFNRTDPSRVYCSEFTALALAAGGAPPPRPSPVNPNESVAVVLSWLEITTPDIIPAGAIIAEGRRAALFSRMHTPAQIQAYFDVKAELHRRFTADQKLGNVFRFSAVSGLKFQPEVAAFMKAANSAAAGWSGLSSAEIDQRVRELAEQEFGPVNLAPVAADGRGSRLTVLPQS